jgi:hypothetical protein
MSTDTAASCYRVGDGTQFFNFLNLFIFTEALHVLGGSSAYHQEHIAVHTASGNVNRYCC